MTTNRPLALIGIPWDEGSSFLRGAAQAPPAIRRALYSDAGNLCSEMGVDFGNEPRFVDLGDREIAPGEKGYLGIEGYVAEVLADGAMPLVLGGDHSITFPVLRAIAEHHGPVEILHFDAHPDLYDTLDGNRHSHACPFARILEEGLALRLVQVGIRTLNPHQRQQAERFGVVEMHTMRDLCAGPPRFDFSGPLYLSFDLDVFDPAYAPGVSHHEPGGLSVRQALDWIQGLEAPLVGADIVELNPGRDPDGRTAMVAAKLVKEIGSMMLLRSP
jgi:agmatinase